MREQLIQYVELLFAGAPGAEEIRQEILQNTLDRYDDLMGQGKSPEAAYRLAISGIGDINEILGADASAPVSSHAAPADRPCDDARNRKMRAAAIALYIISAIPLIVLSELGLDTVGLCCTLLLVAAATALIMMSRSGKDKEEASPNRKNAAPANPLRDSIERVSDAVTLAVYLIVSFATKAWLITWLIFPISGCIQGLINAILDLKEVNANET